MDGNSLVYQKTSQFENEMAASESCGPALSSLYARLSEALCKLTRQFKLAHLSPAPQIVLVLIDFPQLRAILLVLLVRVPVFLRAMCRPSTVRAFELNMLLLYMRMTLLMTRSAYRTGCKLFYCFPSFSDGREG